MLDDFDLDLPDEEDDEGLDDIFPSEDEGAAGGGLAGLFANRTFVMVAGGLGALIVITLIGVAIYLFINRPDPAEIAANETATAAVIATGTSQARTETAAALMPSLTPTETLAPSATSSPTIDVSAPTATDTPGGPTADPRTATVQALLTQAALAQTQAAASILTVSPTPTATARPDTGFMDDVGTPTLFGLTALLLIVIFIARRLRAVNA